MAWTSKQDREHLKQLFTHDKVDEIVWEYQAGGDSLNEYTTIFYLKGKQVEPDIFDPTDLILDNVDISEASDGHYLGEFGTVTITLENNDLGFNKVFQSEWNENQDLFISIKLTDEEAEVAKKITELRIEVGEEEIDNIEFKEDLYVGPEMTFIINNLVDKICDIADDKVEHVEEEMDDYRTMTKISDVNSDNEMEFRLDYSILEIVDGYK